MTVDKSQRPSILSVSQLNRAAKEALEFSLAMVWVEGELTNFSRPSSGHWYFTLKDAKAQVRCAMFKGRNFAVRFKPENGSKVLVRAGVSLYEGRGDYQLIVEHMEPAGAGDLQRLFEQTKAKLQAEGLFDPLLKQPLPLWPKKLAVITSPSGAAVHDILHVLQRRFPALPVVVVPVPVQGSEAAPKIVKAIADVNQLNLADVVIVARGGGSLEDLWCFNDEAVARAVAASRLPIISAVGHEVDFTICDFAADVRAPTPSAAAELVSPDGNEIARLFQSAEMTLRKSFTQILRNKRHQLEKAQTRLKHPKDNLLQQTQTLDQLEIRLKQAWQKSVQRHRNRLSIASSKLAPKRILQNMQLQSQHISNLKQRLCAAQIRLKQAKEQRFKHAAALLNNLSPLNTLQRGYAIVTNLEGEVVQDSQQVSKNQLLRAQLKQGSLEVAVTKVD